MIPACPEVAISGGGLLRTAPFNAVIENEPAPPQSQREASSRTPSPCNPRPELLSVVSELVFFPTTEIERKVLGT
jgi:hypothetical protein